MPKDVQHLLAGLEVEVVEYECYWWPSTCRCVRVELEQDELFMVLVHLRIAIFRRIIPNAVSTLLVEYPSSKRLSYHWTLGSLLGFILTSQIVSGIMLCFHYNSNAFGSFARVDYLRREVWSGLAVRSCHANGASFFFLLLFLHLLRGMYYHSYQITLPWLSGVTILLLAMRSAFLGYVLPWGQISLWGATVITNLVSTIPIVGTKLVWWVWGGHDVCRGFFFTLHFLLPFTIALMVLLHLVVLHETSRTRSLLMHESFTKVRFYPYYIWKDLLNVTILFIIFSLFVCIPWVWGDPENWQPANQMSSPVHIQPEWYFLFAYAILRRVPNLLLILWWIWDCRIQFYLFPLCKMQYPKNKIIASMRLSRLSRLVILLTLLGACSVEAPYDLMSQVFRISFFALMVLYLLS